MFDLNAGVDFDEVELVLLVHDELYGGGVGIVGGLNHPDGRFTHGHTCLFRQFAGRALLDEFLVSPLRRTVAFPKMNHIAMMVRQDLNFDVSWFLHEFFDVDLAVAKGGFGFGPGLRKGRF